MEVTDKQKEHSRALVEIQTLKARISCTESEIMSIALKNGFDPYVFIKHDFSGDTTAIDDLIIKLNDGFVGLNREEITKYFFDKLSDICVKSRFLKMNDKAFVINVRALFTAYLIAKKELA